MPDCMTLPPQTVIKICRVSSTCILVALHTVQELYHLGYNTRLNLAAAVWFMFDLAWRYSRDQLPETKQYNSCTFMLQTHWNVCFSQVKTSYGGRIILHLPGQVCRAYNALLASLMQAYTQSWKWYTWVGPKQRKLLEQQWSCWDARAVLYDGW